MSLEPHPRWFSQLNNARRILELVSLNINTMFGLPEHQDHGFVSRPGHGCMSAFSCSIILCRLRPCDGLIPGPRNPTRIWKRIHSFRISFSFETGQRKQKWIHKRPRGPLTDNDLYSSASLRRFIYKQDEQRHILLYQRLPPYTPRNLQNRFYHSGYLNSNYEPSNGGFTVWWLKMFHVNSRVQQQYARYLHLTWRGWTEYKASVLPY
jgi:hypothetical protein